MVKRIFIGVMLAATLLVGAAACTPAELQALQGMVKSIDSVSGNVTVQLKDGTTTTFNFKDVKVAAIRQALGGLILEHGDNVTIKRDGRGRVWELKSRKGEVEGVIKSKGADNVTIAVKNKRDITLVVTSNTTIKIEGKTAPTLADLNAGQEVEATYDLGTLKAIRIEVESSKEVDTRAGVIEGAIKSISSDNKSFVVTGVRKGDLTLGISSNTTIMIAGKGTVPVARLKVGQMVKVTYDVTSLKAIRIFIVAGGRGSADWNQQGGQDNNGRRNGWDGRKSDGNNKDKDD